MKARARAVQLVDTVARFRIGSTDDTVLLTPAALVADAEGVFVLDAGGHRVTAFSRSGERLWTFGARGAGPNEFASPQDIKLGADGSIWVLDVANARITVLSRDGLVERRIPLNAAESTGHQFVPASTGEAVLIVGDPDQPFVRLAADGGKLERLAFPWPGFRDLHPLASQLTAARAADGTWAAGFSLGDGFAIFPPGPDRPRFHRFVEHVPFPAVVDERAGDSRSSRLDRPQLAARSMSIDGGVLHVLFGGGSELRNEVIDRYAVATGEYLESWVLPRKVNRATVAGGTIYALFSDPYPSLVAWTAPAGK